MEKNLKISSFGLELWE